MIWLSEKMAYSRSFKAPLGRAPNRLFRFRDAGRIFQTSRTDRLSTEWARQVHLVCKVSKTIWSLWEVGRPGVLDLRSSQPCLSDRPDLDNLHRDTNRCFQLH